MSFNTALSGINAANADLNVTANNIANVKTTGFKQSRAEFADLFSSTAYGLARNAIGSGVKLSNVAQQFSQGNIDPTGRSLDMAIDGEGFFTLSKNGATLYSRAGNFQTDGMGYVINPEGARLQVYPPNAAGNGFDVGRTTDLRLLTTDSPPNPTGRIELAFTLPANATQPTIDDGNGGTIPRPFDPADPASYNTTSGGVTVFDSLGVAHVQTSYFVKTDVPNQWQMHNYVDGQPVGGPVLLEFNDSGALVTPADGIVALDPYDPGNGAGVLDMRVDVTGAAQYGERFQLRNVNQNGHAAGKLNEISIGTDGVVFARYSNGADAALGQVALTTFTNPQGLQAVGGNAWAETHASGAARTGSPDTSDFGQIHAGALESSTVDLTEQLVNMIVAQRNFQANAQMITTQDQTTQTVINIR